MAYAYASIVLAVAFLAILVLLHFLKPELDPSWRMISEYEIGRFRWMMRLAFFCWGANVLALTFTTQPSLQHTSGTIGRWWLILNSSERLVCSARQGLRADVVSAIILSAHDRRSCAPRSMEPQGGWSRVRKIGGLALCAVSLLAVCAQVGCAEVRQATPVPRRVPTTTPRTAGWPQWDEYGHGRLVGTSEQGGAGVPGYDDGTVVTTHSTTEGVDVWQALTVAATPQTRLTVLGHPSQSIRRAEDITDGTMTVDFGKRGDALVASSIDTSPSGGEDVVDVLMSKGLAAAQNARVIVMPLAAPVARSELERARAQRRAHPGQWLFIDRDGTGYVAGVVVGGGIYLGATPGALSVLNVSHRESVSGVSLRTGIYVLIDRHSVYESGSRFRSLLDATGFPPSIETGTSAPECLFAVRRVGTSAVVREGVALSGL